MFSKYTIVEILRAIDLQLSNTDVDRMVTIFNLPYIPIGQNPTKNQKINHIISTLLHNNYAIGPFTDNIVMDLIQYLVDDFHIKNPRYEDGLIEYDGHNGGNNFSNAFAKRYKYLGYNLKRDGYIVEGRKLKKLLPAEIQETKVESELATYLKKFSFSMSESHLKQATDNHSQGNWAGANSQFRTFVESILIEICTNLLPSNPATTAAKAINLLSDTVSPPFFRRDLNEVPNNKDEDSFVWGLWARFHPNGSHPGLSDEDDCSFRYLMSIIFVSYLLRRLEARVKVT